MNKTALERKLGSNPQAHGNKTNVLCFITPTHGHWSNRLNTGTEMHGTLTRMLWEVCLWGIGRLVISIIDLVSWYEEELLLSFSVSVHFLGCNGFFPCTRSIASPLSKMADERKTKSAIWLHFSGFVWGNQATTGRSFLELFGYLPDWLTDCFRICLSPDEAQVNQIGTRNAFCFLVVFVWRWPTV